MQPAQPDRPVSTIYNNIIGEGRAAPAAPDPSLDHFWRVLFGHFPKTVVKFIKKAPTKTTSKMVPMANSLAFWRRAGTTLYRVPSRHPGSQRMVFSRGARVPQRGAPHGCSQPGMPQQVPLEVPRHTRDHRSRASGRCEKPTRHRWVPGIPHGEPQEVHRLDREHRSSAPWRCGYSSNIKSAHTTFTRGPTDPRQLVTRPTQAKSTWNGAPSNLMTTNPRPRGKKKISQLSAMTCRVQVVAESLGVFSLRGLGGSQHTSA